MWITILIFLWTRNYNHKYSELEIRKTLVKLCVKMYFKLYFEISTKHLLEDGPRYILQLKIRKTLPVNVINIITPYIQTGALYSHSEFILISLLTSFNESERSLMLIRFNKLEEIMNKKTMLFEKEYLQRLTLMRLIFKN